MSDFEFKTSIPEDEVPPKSRGSSKYMPIVENMDLLEIGDNGLHLVAPKYHVLTQVKKLATSHLPKKVFQYIQRQKEDGVHIYIYRKQ